MTGAIAVIEKYFAYLEMCNVKQSMVLNLTFSDVYDERVQVVFIIVTNAFGVLFSLSRLQTLN